MPAPMEGPFAEKLKAATAGRDFPKSSPDASAVAEGLDLSRGGKTGREKRRARHEQRERNDREGDGQGVSGRAVHTRGSFVDSKPDGASAENGEREEFKRLFEEVSAQCNMLTQLNAFMEANGYQDAEGNLAGTVTVRLEEANRLMQSYVAESGAVPTTADKESLEKIREQSAQDIADLKEALEGLESAGELALPPEVKALFEMKSDPPVAEKVAAAVSGAAPDQSAVSSEVQAVPNNESAPEKRPYASFGADDLRALWRRQGALDRIDMVANQHKEWQAFDQAIRKFKDEERFKDDLKARGLGERYDQVLRLTGRSEAIATRLEEIRQAFEEKGELDQKEAAFLTAIFFDYHELLAVAEGIAAERERETPIVEAEKEARAKKQEGAAKAVAETIDTSQEKKAPFQEKVSQLKALLDEWKALEDEFGDDALRQAVRSLRRLEKRGSVPPTGKIAKWFAEHDGPKAWQGRSAAADRALLVNDALPGMEGMVRDGRNVVEKLRKERAEAKPTTAPASHEAERKDDAPIERGDVWEAPAKDSSSAGRRVVITGNTSDGWLGYRFFDVDDVGNAKNMGFGQAKTEADMRKWLADEGYTYKERREDEIEPVAASVVTLDRRPVTNGELTEWERMNPVEQNRMRRELFARKDRFVGGLNERLKRAGVNDAERRNTVMKYLDEYLAQVMPLVVPVPLQDTDREALLRDLKKEIAIA